MNAQAPKVSYAHHRTSTPSSLLSTTMAGSKKRKAEDDPGWLSATDFDLQELVPDRLPAGRVKSASTEPEKRPKTERQSSPPKAPRALREPSQKQDRHRERERDRDRDRPSRNTLKYGERKESAKSERESKNPGRIELSKQINGDDKKDVIMRDPDSRKRMAVSDGGGFPDTEEIMRVMGFKSFKSTKNTKVAGNEGAYAVRIDKGVKYRQYMNRKGGFNRPLSPS